MMIYGKVCATLIVIVAFFMQDTNALKCWKCSSDSLNKEFCGRYLDEKRLTSEQVRDNLVECENSAKDEQTVHRCEIYKITIKNNEEVYVRGCKDAPRNAPKDKCLSTNNDTADVKNVGCKVCFTDACNIQLDNASIGVKISKVVVVSLIVLTVLLV